MSLLGEIVEGAERADIERTCAKYSGQNAIICYYGHGADDRWLRRQQQGDVALLKVSDHVPTQNLIIYAVACHTAKKLGPWIVTRPETDRARVYIGYPEGIVTSDVGAADGFALQDVVNAGILALAEGGTAGEALVAIQRAADATAVQRLAEYIAKGSPAERLNSISRAVSPLFNGLVTLLGDKTATWV